MAKTKVNVLAANNVVKGKNKCGKCDQVYKTDADRKKHEEDPRRSILRICQICFFKSCTEAGLVLHNSQVHNKARNISVPSIVKAGTKMVAQKPNTNPGGKGVQKPQILRPNLKTAKSDKKPAKKLGTDVNLKCKFCEHVFNAEVALKIHQSLAHDDNDAEENTVQKIPKVSTGKFFHATDNDCVNLVFKAPPTCIKNSVKMFCLVIFTPPVLPASYATRLLLCHLFQSFHKVNSKI